jgi:hypothetical protein
LLISEFIHWRTIETKHDLSIDKSLEETFDIEFDVTFPHMQCRCFFFFFLAFHVLSSACPDLTVEVKDKSGIQQADIRNNVYRHELAPSGYNPGRESLQSFFIDSLRYSRPSTVFLQTELTNLLVGSILSHLGEL